MKWFFVALMLIGVLLLGCKAEAVDLLSTDLGTDKSLVIGLDNWEAGTYYDVRHKEVLAGMQVSIVDFKELLSADIGILTDAHSTPWMFGLGADITTLIKMSKLNWNMPWSLHLTTFVARDFKLSWDEGGRIGFGAVVRF